MKNETKWELISPAGVPGVTPLKLNQHPRTLEGKTVLLRWNGKHNGDVFLDRIAQLLIKSVKSVKVVKGWQVAPETATISSNPGTSKEFAAKLAQIKPDIVIAAQAD